MPVTDLIGTKAMISFYVVLGDGLILLGNEVEHKSVRFGPENILFVPADVIGPSEKGLWLPFYNTSISRAHSDAVRAYVMVVPSKLNSFKSFFAAIYSLITRNAEKATKQQD